MAATSAPKGGTEAPDHSSALGMDSHGEPEVTSADSPQLEEWDWQPNPLWHAPAGFCS